jgi:hypothetical protein
MTGERILVSYMREETMFFQMRIWSFRVLGRGNYGHLHLHCMVTRIGRRHSKSAL